MKLKKLSFLTRRLFELRKQRFMRRYCVRFTYPHLAKLFFEQLWQMLYATKELYVSPHRLAADLTMALVIGEARSGKTHLLNASRQILPQSSYLHSDYQPIATRNMPRFLASPQRLYWELPQYFFVNESAKQIPYLEQFMLFLQNSGSIKSIKQVIFTVGITQLFQQDPEKLEEFWGSIAVMLERLARPLDVYIVVTELDLLQGFVEYFSDLSIEERQHAFGFLLDQQNSLMTQFQRQMLLLTQRLQRRMWWRAQSETIMFKRVFVAEFSKQFSELSEKLLAYLKPLLLIVEHQPGLQLSGCFFTSTKQEGQPLDLLIDDQTAILAAHREVSTLPMLVQHREYFVRGFFPHLQTNVLHTTKMSVRPSSEKKFIFPAEAIISFFAVLLLLIVVFVGLWGGAWWRLDHALSSEKVLAYTILSGRDIDQNLTQFVAYETPFIPQRLQKSIAQSSTLRTWVVDNTKAYLNAQWNKEVYAGYQKNIAGKYPIASEASQEVDLNTFNQFYGPEGTLNRFDRRYLQSAAVQALFVQDNALISLYENVKRLQQILYQNGVSPSWAFNAYLNNLGQDVHSVDVMMAGTKMNLRSNVLLAGTFTWPNAQPLQESGYAVEYGQRLPKMQVFQGNWSWLKFFSLLHWQRNDGSNDFMVSSVGGEFSLIVNAQQSVAELPAIFKSLAIPQNI